MDCCFASHDKNQIFSKIWTTVTNHSYCISWRRDWIFDELFSIKGEKKGLLILHVPARLTEGWFGVASKHITGSIEAHRHRGTVFVTLLVEASTAETMDAGLVQQTQFDSSQLGADFFLLAAG